MSALLMTVTQAQELALTLRQIAKGVDEIQTDFPDDPQRDAIVRQLNREAMKLEERIK